ANDTQNTISDELDVFVINSQLFAKATKLNISGNVIVKSSLEIAPIILVPTIPAKTFFNYSPAQAKRGFGTNGKILPNITNVFLCAPLLWDISNEVNFGKFGQVKISRTLDSIKGEINGQQGTADAISQWIAVYKLGEMQAIDEFNHLASLLRKFDEIQTDTDSFL